MINAIIQNKNGDTIIWGFPNDTGNLYCELRTIGIQKWPSDIKVIDEEEHSIKVKLYADNNIGNHLIRLFSEKHCLEDIETVALTIKEANEFVKEELEQKIINDQYETPEELLYDIRRMLYRTGTVSESFYFPLSGSLYDEDYGGTFQVGNSYLQHFADRIQEKLEIYLDQDTQSMAKYFDKPGKEKLLLADWHLECVDNKLYGKVDVRLKEPMTLEETKHLKDWILGQNSDGLGEGFEQQGIRTEDGLLYVSFWNSRDDYFVYDQEEMNKYIDEQYEQQMGEM